MAAETWEMLKIFCPLFSVVTAYNRSGGAPTLSAYPRRVTCIVRGEWIVSTFHRRPCMALSRQILVTGKFVASMLQYLGDGELDR
jgi:hypothetical protein